MISLALRLYVAYQTSDRLLQRLEPHITLTGTKLKHRGLSVSKDGTDHAKYRLFPFGPLSKHAQTSNTTWSKTVSLYKDAMDQIYTFVKRMCISGFCDRNGVSAEAILIALLIAAFVLLTAPLSQVCCWDLRSVGWLSLLALPACWSAILPLSYAQPLERLLDPEARKELLRTGAMVPLAFCIDAVLGDWRLNTLLGERRLLLLQLTAHALYQVATFVLHWHETQHGLDTHQSIVNTLAAQLFEENEPNTGLAVIQMEDFERLAIHKANLKFLQVLNCGQRRSSLSSLDGHQNAAGITTIDNLDSARSTNVCAALKELECLHDGSPAETANFAQVLLDRVMNRQHDSATLRSKNNLIFERVFMGAPASPQKSILKKKLGSGSLTVRVTELCGATNCFLVRIWERTESLDRRSSLHENPPSQRTAPKKKVSFNAFMRRASPAGVKNASSLQVSRFAVQQVESPDRTSMQYVRLRNDILESQSKKSGIQRTRTIQDFNLLGEQRKSRYLRVQRRHDSRSSFTSLRSFTFSETNYQKQIIQQSLKLVDLEDCLKSSRKLTHYSSQFKRFNATAPNIDSNDESEFGCGVKVSSPHINLQICAADDQEGSSSSQLVRSTQSLRPLSTSQNKLDPSLIMNEKHAASNRLQVSSAGHVNNSNPQSSVRWSPQISARPEGSPVLPVMQSAKSTPPSCSFVSRREGDFDSMAMTGRSSMHSIEAQLQVRTDPDPVTESSGFGSLIRRQTRKQASNSTVSPEHRQQSKQFREDYADATRNSQSLKDDASFLSNSQEEEKTSSAPLVIETKGSIKRTSTKSLLKSQKTSRSQRLNEQRTFTYKIIHDLRHPIQAITDNIAEIDKDFEIPMQAAKQLFSKDLHYQEHPLVRQALATAQRIKASVPVLRKSKSITQKKKKMAREMSLESNIKDKSHVLEAYNSGPVESGKLSFSLTAKASGDVQNVGMRQSSAPQQSQFKRQKTVSSSSSHDNFSASSHMLSSYNYQNSMIKTQSIGKFMTEERGSQTDPVQIISKSKFALIRQALLIQKHPEKLQQLRTNFAALSTEQISNAPSRPFVSQCLHSPPRGEQKKPPILIEEAKESPEEERKEEHKEEHYEERKEESKEESKEERKEESKEESKEVSKIGSLRDLLRDSTNQTPSGCNSSSLVDSNQSCQIEQPVPRDSGHLVTPASQDQLFFRVINNSSSGSSQQRLDSDSQKSRQVAVSCSGANREEVKLPKLIVNPEPACPSRKSSRSESGLRSSPQTPQSRASNQLKFKNLRVKTLRSPEQVPRRFMKNPSPIKHQLSRKRKGTGGTGGDLDSHSKLSAEDVDEQQRSEKNKRPRSSSLNPANHKECGKALQILAADRKRLIRVLQKCLQKIMKVRKQLESMKSQSEMSMSLMKDLMNQAQLANNTFTMENEYFDLLKLVRNSLQMIRVQAKSRKVNLAGPVLQDPLHRIYFKSIYGDLRRYTQIIVNFVSNAIKFTPAEGLVSVILSAEQVTTVQLSGTEEDEHEALQNSVFSAPEDAVVGASNELVMSSDFVKDSCESNLQPANEETKDDIVETVIRFKMTFKDTGIGISEENQKRLFSNFGKLEQGREQNKSGVGLGLSICHEIILKSGGDVRINSKEGHGTEFIITMTTKARALKRDWVRLKQGIPLSDSEESQQEAQISEEEDDIVEGDEPDVLGIAQQLEQADGQEFMATGNQGAPNAHRNNLHLQLPLEQFGVLTKVTEDVNESVALSHRPSLQLEESKKSQQSSRRSHRSNASIMEDVSNELSARSEKILSIQSGEELKVLPSKSYRISSNEMPQQNEERKAQPVLLALPKQPYALCPPSRCLVANDTPFLLVSFAEMLGEYFTHVEEAADGLQAVNAVKAHPVNYFNVIILDITMPIMDGIQACKEIKAYFSAAHALGSSYDNKSLVASSAEPPSVSNSSVNNSSSNNNDPSSKFSAGSLGHLPYIYALTSDADPKIVEELKQTGFRDVFINLDVTVINRLLKEAGLPVQRRQKSKESADFDIANFMEQESAQQSMADQEHEDFASSDSSQSYGQDARREVHQQRFESPEQPEVIEFDDLCEQHSN